MHQLLPYLSWLGLLLPTLSTAQAQAPAGGYVLHPVTHLEAVAGPPGGLVPVRVNDRWGYQDTTGRVWIQPVFTKSPSFFYDGFGQVSNEYFPAGNEGRKPRYYTDDYTFINARGECLRRDTGTVVLRDPDGSLRLEPYRQHLFQPTVRRFVRLGGTGPTGIDTTWGSLRSRAIRNTVRLGLSRGAAYRNVNLGRKPAMVSEYNQAALIDAQGRLLTGFQYAHIEHFREGLAAFQRTGFYVGGWGLLNRQGREITTGQLHAVGQLHRNRVWLLYQEGGHPLHSALIDSTGRLVRGWQPGGIDWAIPGYLFLESLVHGSPAQPIGPHRLLDLDGRPVLGGQLFTRLVALPLAGCVAAKNQDGRWGLLDASLRWRLPAEAEYLRGNGLHENGPELPEYGTNPARFVQVRVRGKWGVVRATDGQLVVPCRYDTLYTPYEQGWLCAGRQGRAYVLKDGRELAEAHMAVAHESGYGQPPGYRAVWRGHEATVMDSLGHLTCPWTDVGREDYSPRPRYLGHGLTMLSVRTPTFCGGLDAQGKVVIPFEFNNYEVRDGILLAEKRDGLSLDKYSAYDMQGRLLGEPLTPFGTLLAGGWAILYDGSLLVDRYGNRYRPPAGCQWSGFPVGEGDYAPFPFEHGVMRVGFPATFQFGYVTKGGTVLP